MLPMPSICTSLPLPICSESVSVASPNKKIKSEGHLANSHPIEELTPDDLNQFKLNSQDAPFVSFQTFFCEGQAYPLASAKEGVFKKVYVFADGNQNLTFNNQTFRTSSVVLKLYKNFGDKLKKNIFDDASALQLLKKLGIPVAECYIDPLRFEMKKNSFMIAQRIDYSVSPKNWKDLKDLKDLSNTDRKTLEFAKKYLTQNAYSIQRGQGEYIGDFTPENVMVKESGELIIIDPSLPEKENGLAQRNLKSYLKKWSNKNPVILNMLIENFPDQIKATL
jgi:hypothetical protein